MNDKHANKNKNCLNSISFAVIGVFIIIFESISLVMSILCVAIINWHFLKNFIKILNNNIFTNYYKYFLICKY